MSPQRSLLKKSPKFLEDITYTIAECPFDQNDDIFCSELFLGKYSESRLMELLDRFGLLGILHRRGYRDLIVSISRHEDYTSRLYLNFESLDKETRLIELIVREGIFRPKEQLVSSFDFSDGLSMLLIEWLALQDPRGQFREERPPLPGQVYPGLGALINIHNLLKYFARSGRKDALVDVPEYYHAAAIYSRSYNFFSPLAAGQVKAMMRDFDSYPLADISFAVDAGCMINRENGNPESWEPSEQIAAISEKMQAYVACDEYCRLAEETAQKCHYDIDWDKYHQLKAREVN